MHHVWQASLKWDFPSRRVDVDARPIVDIELAPLHEKLVNFSTRIFKHMRLPTTVTCWFTATEQFFPSSRRLRYSQYTCHRIWFLAWNLIGTPWKSRPCCGLMRSRKSIWISNQKSYDNMKSIWNEPAIPQKSHYLYQYHIWIIVLMEEIWLTSWGW